MKTRRPFLLITYSLLTVHGLSLNTLSGQGFIGHEVSLYGKYFDNEGVQQFGSPYFAGSAKVDAGLEFEERVIKVAEGELVFVPIDLDAYSIEIDSSSFENFESAEGKFNGYIIEDTHDTLPDFLSATLNDSVTNIQGTRLLVSPNAIWVNDEGVKIGKNGFQRIEVTFADNRTPASSVTLSASEGWLVEGPTEFGATYIFERSQDLVTFESIDQPFIATHPFSSTYVTPEDPHAYYRLRKTKDASIPLWSDFESDGPGWTVEGSGSGTSWERGAPNGAHVQAAYSGGQAWGTNLTGDYTSSANSTLISPLVDLRSHARPAILFFRYVVDIPSTSEGGQLRFVGENGEVLHTHETLFTGESWDWKLFFLELPQKLQERTFRLQFRFLADDDDRVGDGWFIDDVRVL